MNIGVDLDEVLAELMDQLIVFYNNKAGACFRKTDFEAYDLSETWGISQEAAITVVEDFYKSREFTEIRPVEGAQDACAKLKRGGHNLFIITARPASREAATMEWVEKFFPGLFRQVIFTGGMGRKGGKKSNACAQLEIGWMVEDAAHYAEDCLSEKTKVILLDRPWNMDFENKDVLRARNWGDVLKIIG